jgi:hypothetical protein
MDNTANLTSAFLIAIPMACYIGVAMNEGYRGNYPGAITFTGYAIGNIGLMWSIWQ